MAEAKAEAQESSSPRCLLLLAGGLQAACQAVSAERFCLLALARRLPMEHVSDRGFRPQTNIGLRCRPVTGGLQNAPNWKWYSLV